MKKKKTIYEENSDVLIEHDLVYVKQHSNEIYFQIGFLTTNDVAEAVSVMMKILDEKDPIWNYKIKNKNINIQNTLYWLTGGDDEWINLKNYNQPWNKCMNLYEEEFEETIINIIEKSISLKDIKNGFKKKLHMFKMYDFALSKNLIK